MNEDATASAILDWIREDAPTSVKMALTPSHVAKLIERLRNASVRQAEIEGAKNAIKFRIGPVDI